MAHTALITTTINVPELLLDYARDAKEHGRDVKVCVAGDRKTPPEAAEFCAGVESETKVPCEYMGVEDQERFLEPWPELAGLLPWNCVQRRNVAVLKAYADGAGAVVTIDDDNLVAREDYFGGHGNVGGEEELEEFGEDGKWFNVCRFLETRNGYQFVARGYGMAARAELPDAGSGLSGSGRRKRRVAVNAGLWLGDPDIDAVTRLACRPEVTGCTANENFFVAPGALTPFNSQNTALARHAVPAYFLSPSVGRFDDILASFIVKRIADHLGEGVSFGNPLVRQDRNEHDLFRDLDLEMMGMRIVDGFTEELAKVSLSAGGYAGCAVEIADAMEGEIPSYAAEEGDRKALAEFFAGCRLWANLPLWD